MRKFSAQMDPPMGGRSQKINAIRNKQGPKKARDLVIEGFYNNQDRRRKAVKELYGLFVSQ